VAVYIGKAVGAGLADKAEIVGGVMLILIGVKLLLEGIL
jgi:putative Mn2+ efflux pump MntP